MPEAFAPEKTASLIAVIDEPLPLDTFADRVVALTAEHGTGLVLGSRWNAITVWTPGRICSCVTCETATAEAYWRLTGRRTNPVLSLCPECGNKRCPTATHHGRLCTGSNDPGQPGSIYA